MNISGKLRRLGKTKLKLLERKREMQEQSLPRFYVVDTNKEADRIKAAHAATGITVWQPLIVVLTDKEVSTNE